MQSNNYARNPLQVTVLNPRTVAPIRTYFLLGAVPRAVLDAAKRGAPAAVLQAHYGKGWRATLTPGGTPRAESMEARVMDWKSRPRAEEEDKIDGGGEENEVETPLNELQYVSGGAVSEDASFTEMYEVDDYFMPILPEAEAPGQQSDDDDMTVPPSELRGAVNWDDLGTTTQRAKRGSAAVAPAGGEGVGDTVFTTWGAYPEDSLEDLRGKIYAATGIPPYRQHLFYTASDGLLRACYNITVESLGQPRGPVSVDGRRIFATESPRLAGVPIDPALEERRATLRVESLDAFRTLEVSPGNFVTRAYVVDLFSVLPPLTAPERRADGLEAVLADRYQFDLLYYGVLKYFPLLSPEALRTALTDPASMTARFPRLHPDRAVLETRLRAERDITDAIYAAPPSESALGWGSRSESRGLAVTAATTLTPAAGAKTRVDIRNVFDLAATSPALPALVARWEAPDPDGLVGVRQGVKRHASSHMPRQRAAIDAFVAHQLVITGRQWAGAAPRIDASARLRGRNAAHFALWPGDAADEGSSKSAITLSLQENGAYTVESWWREDDRVGLDRVLTETAAVVGPAVEAINAAGAAVLPVGGVVSSPTAGTTSFGQMTVSLFWPRALTSGQFQVVKGAWRDYEKAGIITIRGLQQSGIFTFLFRKGVVAYDPSAIDRVSAPRGSRGAEMRAAAAAESANAEAQGGALDNRYAYLSDPVAAQRWASVYGGRQVRIHHRATDLKIEVTGAVGMRELETIRAYLFAQLETATAALKAVSGQAAAASAAETLRGPGSRRLRRLQERDPDLYDLRKYDEGATVYSVLCQSERQPHIFNEEEAATLPPRKRAALAAYWNFTEKRPAYYECPSPRYPFLTFRAGKHPLGYCLPCCKKTRPPADSRAGRTNATCTDLSHAKDRRQANEPSRSLAWSNEKETSRHGTLKHVLTYGKVIPLGRMSEAPPAIASELLVESGPVGHLRLAGVEQSLPSIPAAGFAFSLAECLDEELADFAGTLAKAARAMGESYRVLASGAAAVFPEAAQLADALLSAFARRESALTPLSPGGAAGRVWEALVAELVQLAYGVCVVRFTDRTDPATAAQPMPDVFLEAAPAVALALRAPGARVAMVVSSPAGVYPMFAYPPRRNVQTPPPAPIRLFTDAATLGALARALDSAVPPCTQRFCRAAPDLALVTRFGRASPENAPVLKLIDSQDMCRGVVLKSGVYVPLAPSPHSPDGVAVRYGPRPAEVAEEKAVLDFVAALNAFSAAEGTSYAPLVSTHSLIHAGRVIGFIANGLYFYHVARDPAPGDRPEQVLVPYDPLAVDEALHAALTRAPTADSGFLAQKARTQANEATRVNLLYRLFRAEFSARVRRERNAPLRAALAAAVRHTDYRSPRALAALRAEATRLLADFPEDLATFHAILVHEYYAERTTHTAEGIIAATDGTLFEFDSVTMQKLRDPATTPSAVAAAVRAAMKGAVQLVDRFDADAPIANIYSACEDAPESQPQCRGGKLLVPRAKFEPLVDILAQDIRNRYTAAVFSTSAAGVLDEQSYIIRPGEALTVKALAF